MNGSIARTSGPIRGRLARLAVAGGVVLAATGAAVTAAAGPAQAAVIVNATAAAAGQVSQSSVAACPAGQFLTGAGGQIVGGTGDVTLTDVIPDLAAQTVTVWGHSNPGAAPPAYSVVAQAICVPGAAPANYQLVTAVSANNPNPIKSQPAACPAGTAVMGLGAQLAGASGQVFYQQIQPNAALAGGTVTAAASGGFAGNWQVTTHLICATPPAGIAAALVTATGPNNNASPKSQASPACPGNALTTGVGGQISNTAAGNVILSQMMANGGQNGSFSGGVSDGLFLANWSATTFNICWG